MEPRMLAGVIALVGLLAVVLAACGDGEEDAEQTVHISLTEWSIAGEPGHPISTIDTGKVTLEVHNDGKVLHELVIIKTDLAAGRLPVKEAKVDEDAAGEVIGEVEEFDAGKIETATFDLESGRYVFVCNIAGHYQQGMFAEVTVQ